MYGIKKRYACSHAQDMGPMCFLPHIGSFPDSTAKPKILYTDHAPSLIKAAETPDWAEIGQQVGTQGTEWRLTAKGCSWRNGLAERVIRSARHSLGHQLRLGETLDFHQFGAVLTTVAAIINSRPLSLRVSNEGEYHPLAPRDILFGKAGQALDDVSRALDFNQDIDQDIQIGNMCEYQAKIVRAWRAQWLESVFPDMVARLKWRVAHRNLQCGDIGHVRYSRAVGLHEWRIAMVEVAQTRMDDGHCAHCGQWHSAQEARGDTGKSPTQPKDGTKAPDRGTEIRCLDGQGGNQGDGTRALDASQESAVPLSSEMT